MIGTGACDQGDLIKPICKAVPETLEVVSSGPFDAKDARQIVRWPSRLTGIGPEWK